MSVDLIIMRKSAALRTVLVVLLIGSAHAQAGSGLAQEKGETKVPSGFSYPEAMGKILIETPIIASSLSGRVVDTNGDGLSKVLVECVTHDWRRRIDATLTDPEGRFHLSSSAKGRFCLRFSLPGWGTVLARITLNRKTKAEINMVLPIAS